MNFNELDHFVGPKGVNKSKMKGMDIGVWVCMVLIIITIGNCFGMSWVES